MSGNLNIQLISGKYFDFTHPGANEFSIFDIAWALSNLCRFNGHCRHFYSVAQHCYLTSILVPDEFKLHALLHDAAEAYVGDMTRPLKFINPDYVQLEKEIEQALFQSFGLPAELPDEVKQADLKMLALENEQLMQGDDWITLIGIEAPKMEIEPMSTMRAYDEFLHRYFFIMDQEISTVPNKPSSPPDMPK